MDSNKSAVQCKVEQNRNTGAWAERVWALLLCAGFGVLLGCGAAQTEQPKHAVYIDAADEGSVLGEYLISVRKSARSEGQQDPSIDVRRHIEWLYNRAKVPLPIQGCGGATDPLLYESKEEVFFCVHLPGGRQDVDQLLGNDAILVIERNLRFTPSGVQVCTSWGLDLVDQPLTQQPNNVFAYGTSGKNVRVYVVDTGIEDPPKLDPKKDDLSKDNSYPLLTNPPAGGKWTHLDVDKAGMATPNPPTRQDCSGHGTYLAETIAGKITGVAKSARLHSVRVSECMHNCKSLTGTDMPLDKADTTENVILKALQEIRDNERAISQYYASNMASNPDRVVVLLAFTPATPAGGFATLERVVKDLVNDNVVLVAAAGNANVDATGYVLTDLAQNIRVGALDRNKQLHVDSNYGPSIDILAPAEGGAARVLGGTHPCGAKIEGSSVAAAFVAGAVAQLLEADPSLAAEKLRGHLQRNDNIIRDRPAMTPYFVLRTERAMGLTGDPGVDGVDHALSYTVCPAGMSCRDIDFCPGNTSNTCRDGLQTKKDDVCGRGVRCESGSCASCGGVGDKCCGGTNKCGFGLSCVQDTCRCGGEDQACCGGNSCASPVGLGGKKLACDTMNKEGPTCKPCGKKGEMCCGDGSCDSGGADPLICNTDNNHCEQCGMKDSQKCCGDGSCRGAGLSCVAGTCTTCGKEGAACCTRPGPKCEGSLECQGGTCGRCGGLKQACCVDRSPCDGEMGCVKYSTDPVPVCHGTCTVRCLNGELGFPGEQRTGEDCKKAGLAFCSSPMCGLGNQLVRARYNGRIYWEDLALCGTENHACCQDEDDDAGVCGYNAAGTKLKCTKVAPTGSCSTDVRICK